MKSYGNLNKSKYLRISITNRCNLACHYCHQEGQGRNSIGFNLNYKDFIWISECSYKYGFKKFKLTGGEPLLNRKILKIINGIKKIGVQDLSLITNGIKLYSIVEDLKKNGLDRINVTLSTLNEKKFIRENGGKKDDLILIKKGVDRAIKIGFSNIKLNYIWHGHHNLSDFLDVLSFTETRDLTVVLLPLLTNYTTSTNDNYCTLKDLYRVLMELGIKEDTLIMDYEGIRKRLVVLKSNVKILLRQDELKDRFPYKKCNICLNKTTCREGIFPIRLSCYGVLYPCLSKGIDGINIFNDIKMRDFERVYNAFEYISTL